MYILEMPITLDCSQTVSRKPMPIVVIPSKCAYNNIIYEHTYKKIMKNCFKKRYITDNLQRTTTYTTNFNGR